MIVQDCCLDSEVNIQIWLQMRCENIPEMQLQDIVKLFPEPLRFGVKLTIHVVTGSKKQKLQRGGRVIGEVVGWNMHYTKRYNLNSSG